MNPIDNIMALADKYAKRYYDFKVKGSYETAHDKNVFWNALRTAIEQALGQGEVVAWMKPHPKCDSACLFQCTQGFTRFPDCAAPQPQPKQEPVKCKHGVDDGACKECYHDTAAPQPQPKREHDLKDVRCECCGYMTYHREHMGCIRAATPQPQPKQEPVKLQCCGYYDATAIKWNQFNGVVQCHNCGESYAPQPRREWVGLTDEDVRELDTSEFWDDHTPADFVRLVENKLREKNGGEA
jgi:hypothetical protein